MINVVTVCNSSYFDFFKIWSYSLIDKVDLDNISSVYVINTGMEQEQISFVKKFPKFKLIETNINSKFLKLHDEGWQSSNNSKLPNIKNILQQDKIPTYFIDVDCIFVQDFYHLLDFDKDIAVCNTKCRKTAAPSSLIGSFYGFNKIGKGIQFIDLWYNELKNSDKIKTLWRESPSLSMVAKENILNIDFQILKESNMSHNMFSDGDEEKFIIHLKSEGAFGFETPQSRLKMPHAAGFIERYLNV